MLFWHFQYRGFLLFFCFISLVTECILFSIWWLDKTRYSSSFSPAFLTFLDQTCSWAIKNLMGRFADNENNCKLQPYFRHFWEVLVFFWEDVTSFQADQSCKHFASSFQAYREWHFVRFWMEDDLKQCQCLSKNLHTYNVRQFYSIFLKPPNPC